MRYRAEIYVDVFADTLEEAEKMVDDFVIKTPNSFQANVCELPHGSEISLDTKEPKSS